MSYDKEQSLQNEIRQMLADQNQEAGKPETKLEVEVPSQAETETSTSEVTPELSEIELKARSLGWKTKEEREAEGKDNSHYVEPDEYVRRQPLFARIEQQKKELSEVKERQRQHEAHLAQVRKEAYVQAVKDLEAKRDEAIDDANSIEARRLDLQARNLIHQMNQDPIVNRPVEQQAPQVNPDVESFKSRNNTWYYNNTNKENLKMTAAADTIDKLLIKQAKIDQGLDPEDFTVMPQLDVKQHLDTIESEMRRMYPHRFETTKKAAASSTQSVGKSTVSGSNTRSSSNLVSRLTPSQRAAGEYMVKSTTDYKTGKANYTLEQYAEDLNKINRLK